MKTALIFTLAFGLPATAYLTIPGLKEKVDIKIESSAKQFEYEVLHRVPKVKNIKWDEQKSILTFDPSYTRTYEITVTNKRTKETYKFATVKPTYEMQMHDLGMSLNTEIGDEIEVSVIALGHVANKGEKSYNVKDSLPTVKSFTVTKAFDKEQKEVLTMIEDFAKYYISRFSDSRLFSLDLIRYDDHQLEADKDLFTIYYTSQTKENNYQNQSAIGIYLPEALKHRVFSKENVSEILEYAYANKDNDKIFTPILITPRYAFDNMEGFKSTESIKKLTSLGYDIKLVRAYKNTVRVTDDQYNKYADINISGVFKAIHPEKKTIFLDIDANYRVLHNKDKENVDNDYYKHLFNLGRNISEINFEAKELDYSINSIIQEYSGFLKTKAFSDYYSYAKQKEQKQLTQYENQFDFENIIKSKNEKYNFELPKNSHKRKDEMEF